jgi:hypothetical protein
VTFDRKFATTPHDAMVARATSQRASLIARLRHHLPQGPYLRQLAASIILGKISHALPAVATPRLVAANGGANTHYKAVQVAINDVARSITGKSRRDHLPVSNLLDLAKIPSVNAMVVSAVAFEAWKAHRSSDGGNGSRNPIGAHVFDGLKGRETRSTDEGIVPIALRGHNTMVTSVATVWNAFPDLRAADTIGAAKRAAKALARGVPL